MAKNFAYSLKVPKKVCNFVGGQRKSNKNPRKP